MVYLELKPVLIVAVAGGAFLVACLMAVLLMAVSVPLLLLPLPRGFTLPPYPCRLPLAFVCRIRELHAQRKKIRDRDLAEQAMKVCTFNPRRGRSGVLRSTCGVWSAGKANHLLVCCRFFFRFLCTAPHEVLLSRFDCTFATCATSDFHPLRDACRRGWAAF